MTEPTISEIAPPLDEFQSGADGVLAQIAPYYARTHTGAVTRLTVSVGNPRPTAEKAVVQLVLPVGWVAVPDVATIPLPPLGRGQVEVDVTVGAVAQRRARVGVDVRIGELRLGQHAEALVDVAEAGATEAGWCGVTDAGSP